MTRNTIIALVLLVAAGLGLGAYFMFFNSSDDTALTQTEASSAAELSFMAYVSKLDPITFDLSLLSDPRFSSRQDIRTAIVPEAAGRKDPFAPIGR